MWKPAICVPMPQIGDGIFKEIIKVSQNWSFMPIILANQEVYGS